MSHNKIVTFGTVKSFTAFTPAPGEIGANKVYVKTPNGICPQLGTEEEGIFYPTDRVISINVNKKFLEHYRK